MLQCAFVPRGARHRHDPLAPKPTRLQEIFARPGKSPANCVASRATTILMRGVRQSNPTGKSLRIFGNDVKPRFEKIFLFSFDPNHFTSIAIPSRSEGRRPRHERGTGCGGRRGALDERHGSVRRRRVVLTPRCWRQVGGLIRKRRWQQAGHRGERAISRKAIAQGMSDCLRCPVCSCAHFSCTLHTRPRVQRASGIPCALFDFRGGEEIPANLGRIAPREGEFAFAVGRLNPLQFLSANVRVPDAVQRPCGAPQRRDPWRETRWIGAISSASRRWRGALRSIRGTNVGSVFTSRRTSASRAVPVAADRHIRRMPAGRQTVLPAPPAIPRTVHNRRC